MRFGMLARKLGMTQIYREDNSLVPVTVFQVGPCAVTQVKELSTDGYSAVQIAFGSRSSARMSLPLKGHLSKAGVSSASCLREFNTDDTSSYVPGQILTVDLFKVGQKVDAVAFTKGRGFQGVVRRYNFSGQPDSHGSMMHRRIGSIGQRQTPGHVFKNKKMPGHMGVRRRTMQNLEVLGVDVSKNLLMVKGSCPGNNHSLVYLRVAKKTIKSI